LPVRRVVLYKNGVGYFEHQGRVTGNQAVTIDFTSAQLDDALQSLTAIDLGGGRIAAVDFNSTTPLEQQLKNIPLGLGDDPSTQDLYTALRGARVEVSGPGLAPFSGRIVDYETRTEKSAAGSDTTRAFLTVVSDEGAVRTLEVTPAVSVRVLDGGLRRDLDDYLALLASAQNRQVRHLTLEAEGTGARDIRVSYITEVPVWKSTYRIVFQNSESSGAASGAAQSALLQGWAVVDNTGGSDWDHVQLSLVAGAPQSFTEPLSQPIYTQRPEVPVPEAENVAPSIHESGEAAPAPMASSSQTVMVNGQPAAPTATARREMRGVMGGVLGALGTGPAPGSGLLSMIRPEPLQDESGTATSAKFDDFFEYTLAQPITLRRNQSALVPFLQTSARAERVTLFGPGSPVPLRALWLTNSSSLTLDRGSFSVFENGEFAGEGLTDPIHPGEKRLLSYAVDQAVHVTRKDAPYSSYLRHIAVSDGIITERNLEFRASTYSIHNAAPDDRVVIVEYPSSPGWKLEREIKPEGIVLTDADPVETTPSAYRFRVVVKAGQTAELRVGQTHTLSTRVALATASDEHLRFLINTRGFNGSVAKALAPVLAARARLHTLETELAANQQQIDRAAADSTRLHDNLQGLKDTPEERALARRYAGEMNADEDQLQSLRKDRSGLEQQQTAAQQALDDAIHNLNLDQDM
ncbi:MAG: hypothetical protein WBD46_00340, partial [Acidobacteriaceae bacterium]